MALKDAIDKIVSYFDTDEVTDYEDAAKEEAKERPVKAQKPVQTPPPRQQRQPERSQATDRKSTRLNSSHLKLSRMPSSA